MAARPGKQAASAAPLEAGAQEEAGGGTAGGEATAGMAPMNVDRTGEGPQVAKQASIHWRHLSCEALRLT